MGYWGGLQPSASPSLAAYHQLTPPGGAIFVCGLNYSPVFSAGQFKNMVFLSIEIMVEMMNDFKLCKGFLL